MRMILITLALVFSTTAFGFEGLNSGKSLQIFNRIDCSEGIECYRHNDKFMVEVKKSDLVQERSAATAGTLTAAQCGTTFYNTAAVELDLPDAATALGCRYTFVVLNASNYDIDPDAADQILGLTDAAGDKIRNSTIGGTITLEAVSASQWAVIGSYGTWSDAD